MADVFKRFITNVTTTDLTTVFTVPTANVAATPPTPVSTFIVKTINVHNYDGSAAVTVNVDHNNGSADFQIFVDPSYRCYGLCSQSLKQNHHSCEHL